MPVTVEAGSAWECRGTPPLRNREVRSCYTCVRPHDGRKTPSRESVVKCEDKLAVQVQGASAHRGSREAAGAASAGI